MMPIRTLFIVATNLGPYHLARFTALSNAGLDLTIVRTPVRENVRPWDVDLSKAEFHIEQLYYEAEQRSWQDLLGLTQTYLERNHPQVVVCVGYNRRYVWAVSYCCRRLGIPAILFLVGWARERPRVFWKEWLKRLFCKHFFVAALVTGKRAADYGRKLGFRPSEIWVTGNVVDNEHFSRSERCVSSSASAKLPLHFLTVARLSPEKNLYMLLMAFVRYRERGGTWHLRVVGSGPDEENLKRQVPQICREVVHWLGWKQYEELPEIYAAASCFVLPSLIEPWGLAVNEAMAAGLPVLVSRQCGCVPELCWRGVNGYDFDPLDVIGLSDLMLAMSSGQMDLDVMGRASRQIIGSFTLDTYSKAVVDCIRAISHKNDIGSKKSL